MSEFNPLVQRVDALLKRHQQQVAEAHATEQAVLPAAPPLAEKAIDFVPDFELPEAATAAEPPQRPAAESFDPATLFDPPQATGTPELAGSHDPANVLGAPGLPEAGDDDIPVLTEVIDPATLPAALPGATPPAAPVVDLEALGQQVEAAVLQKVLSELDRTLDQRLGRTITDLLEQVLHGLRAELSVSARQMIREAVARAVAGELAERGKRD